MILYYLVCPNYQDEGVTFKHDDKATYTSGNLMDQWIVSFTQSLLAFVHQEMDCTLVYQWWQFSTTPLPQ